MRAPITGAPETTLAIEGGTPLRAAPFGPRWVFGDEERRQLMEVMDNAPTGWRSQFKVREFADAFATRHGAHYAVAVNSGTGAIHTAVGAINPEPGDEIITTPVSDIGSVLGIVLHNAIPVFADWDSATFTIDPADVERRITPRTRAILVVHLFGNPCDMDAILGVARRHGLRVIEDCSQAHLARYRGRLVGTLGDIACFSLGGKTLTTDMGGMVLTNDEALARRALGFARKGAEVDEALRSSLAPTSLRRGSRRGYAFLGDFHPMTDLEAAVGLAQLGRWDEATRVRRRSAAILDEIVPRLPGFRVQAGPSRRRQLLLHLRLHGGRGRRRGLVRAVRARGQRRGRPRLWRAVHRGAAAVPLPHLLRGAAPTAAPATPSSMSRGGAGWTTTPCTCRGSRRSSPPPGASCCGTATPTRTPGTSGPRWRRWPGASPPVPLPARRGSAPAAPGGPLDPACRWRSPPLRRAGQGPARPHPVRRPPSRTSRPATSTSRTPARSGPGPRR